VSGCFTPKSRMGKALVYTYTLLPRLSRYVLDGRYNIDNNGVENAIRPLAIGRSYTHSSAAVRHMKLMFDRGWRTHSEESLQKRILASYYQLLDATTGYYLSNGG